MKRVAVIGGAGDMGRWMAKHFARMGCRVTISDVRRDRAERVADELGVQTAPNNVEAVSDVDATILCVPPEAVPAVVEETADHLKPGSTLVEISSVKTGIFEALRRVSERGVKTLSIHPLFGPGAPSPEGFRVVLIPVRDPEAERKEAEAMFPGAEVVEATLEEHEEAMAYALALNYAVNTALALTLREVEAMFPGAEVVEATLEEHEEAMAYTLALNYAVNTALALTLKGVDLKRLRKLSGPTFAAQLSLSEAVTRTNPDISAAIMTRNAYTLKTLSRYVQNLKALIDAVKEGKTEKLIEMLREAKATLTKDPEYEEAYKKLYRMLQPQGSQSL